MKGLQLDVRVSRSPELNARGIERATHALSAGDRAGAEREYHSAIRAGLLHPVSWSNLAALGVALDDAEGACQHARRALQLDAHSIDGWVNFGVASWHANQRRDAERAFRHALVLSPGLETPALNLTRMWHGIARYDLATDMLQGALARNPGSSRLHQAAAENARLRGQADVTRRHALAALVALLPKLAPAQEVASTATDAATLDAAREAVRHTMATTCDRFASAGIGHIFFGGTVLGIVREGEPFHGDKDIDLGLSPDVDRDQLESLFADGFTLMRVPQDPDSRRWCMGWTDDATGIGVDLFFDHINPDGSRRRSLGWPDSLYYDYPAFALTTIHWRGRDWPVPSPLSEYLASDYGEDWHEPWRRVGERSFDKRWFDTQISSPALAQESLPCAINLVLLRMLTALRDAQWGKALALCDQVLARESIPQVEAVRDRLLVSGIR